MFQRQFQNNMVLDFSSNLNAYGRNIVLQSNGVGCLDLVQGFYKRFIKGIYIKESLQSIVIN